MRYIALTKNSRLGPDWFVVLVGSEREPKDDVRDASLLAIGSWHAQTAPNLNQAREDMERERANLRVVTDTAAMKNRGFRRALTRWADNIQWRTPYARATVMRDDLDDLFAKLQGSDVAVAG
jgi:hypothetical protein